MEENQIKELKEQIGIKTIEEAIEIVNEGIKRISLKREDIISETEIAWEIICNELKKLDYYENYERLSKAIKRIESKNFEDIYPAMYQLAKKDNEIKNYLDEREILDSINIKAIHYGMYDED